MYGYVYKTTNLINGKIYIGQHKHSEFDNKYIGSGTMLFRAIDKYGKENFSCELLEEAYSQDELNKLEKYYVDLYNARDNSIGYNLAEGGIGGSHAAWNKNLTKETNESVAKYVSKRNELFETKGFVGCYGLIGSKNKNSLEYKQTISKILPEFEHFWRFHYKYEILKHFHIGSKAYKICVETLNLNENDESRKTYLQKRRRESFRKAMEKSNSNKVKIKCVETNEVFNSIKEARIHLGLKSSSSLYAALYDGKKCRGLHWEVVK